jgi:ureidoacrylate peracid hydrolase
MKKKYPTIPGEKKFFKNLEDKIIPSHTAVIVVDMQNEFCEKSDLTNRLDVGKEKARLPIQRMKRLVEEARRFGVLVVFTKEIDDPKYMSEPMWERLYRKKMQPYCLSGTTGVEIIDDFRLDPKDEIVIKHRFSAFFESTLDLLLQAHEIKTCIFIGTQTNVCVDSTARDAYFHGYYVVVVDDCTFTYDSKIHEMALQTIEEAFGVVVQSQKIIQVWNELSTKNQDPIKEKR